MATRTGPVQIPLVLLWFLLLRQWLENHLNIQDRAPRRKLKLNDSLKGWDFLIWSTTIDRHKAPREDIERYGNGWTDESKAEHSATPASIAIPE